MPWPLLTQSYLSFRHSLRISVNCISIPFRFPSARAARTDCERHKLQMYLQITKSAAQKQRWRLQISESCKEPPSKVYTLVRCAVPCGTHRTSPTTVTVAWMTWQHQLAYTLAQSKAGPKTYGRYKFLSIRERWLCVYFLKVGQGVVLSLKTSLGSLRSWDKNSKLWRCSAIMPFRTRKLKVAEVNNSLRADSLEQHVPHLSCSLLYPQNRPLMDTSRRGLIIT